METRILTAKDVQGRQQGFREYQCLFIPLTTNIMWFGPVKHKIQYRTIGPIYIDRTSKRTIVLAR